MIKTLPNLCWIARLGFGLCGGDTPGRPQLVTNQASTFISTAEMVRPVLPEADVDSNVFTFSVV